MEIALGAVILIGLIISWEVLKYSKQQKEIEKAYERLHSKNNVRSNKKKKTSKSRTKTTKSKVSDSDKPRKPYKKKKKSLKDKN